MAESVDCVVIGAGVIGLACARAAAQAGREVIVLEQHDVIGSETSSRNSEVIHAGIYYPTGSVKARMCVTGKALLYDYCAERQLPFSRCGKIIVATRQEQLDDIRGYQAQARANGVGELEWLSRDRVLALEPEVAAVGGVLSPTTGIIDSHAFMLSLQGDLERAGGMVAFNTRVEDLRLTGGRSGRPSAGPSGGHCRVTTPELELEAAWLINAGGLHAPGLAASIAPNVPQAHYAIGHYYTYSGKPPFARLVYPVAEPGGLGVHVTLDMAGQVKFGPDVRWRDSVDYRFDGSRFDDFVGAIQNYFPGLDADRLQPGYTGIRPKISGPQEPAADFRIDGPRQHGVSGVVNLLGIESPGLTSSLAIANEVVHMLDSC